MAKGKNVRDVKGEDKSPQKKNEPTQINPGNISVLTVQLLDAINKNLVGLRKELKEYAGG